MADPRRNPRPRQGIGGMPNDPVPGDTATRKNPRPNQGIGGMPGGAVPGDRNGALPGRGFSFGRTRPKGFGFGPPVSVGGYGGGFPMDQIRNKMQPPMGGSRGFGPRERPPGLGPPEQQPNTFQDQFAAFLQQDPSALGIASTQSLADIMGDYADFSQGGNAYNAGDTLQQTIRNKFLGTLSPQDSARVQNHMGYFTGGERVNAPRGGFEWTGSLPESLEPGESWVAQNQGVNYGTYSRGDDGGYSWNPIGDRAQGFAVQPGTTTPMPQQADPRGQVFGGRPGGGRTRRRRVPFMRGKMTDTGGMY